MGVDSLCANASPSCAVTGRGTKSAKARENKLCTMHRMWTKGQEEVLSDLLFALGSGSGFGSCNLFCDDEILGRVGKRLNAYRRRTNTHQARRELGLRANPGAVLVEQERTRGEEKRAASNERAGPVDAEPVEHLDGEEREGRSDAGTDHGVRRERRRAVLQVRVDQVCLKRH